MTEQKDKSNRGLTNVLLIVVIIIIGGSAAAIAVDTPFREEPYALVALREQQEEWNSTFYEDSVTVSLLKAMFEDEPEKLKRYYRMFREDKEAFRDAAEKKWGFRP